MDLFPDDPIQRRPGKLQVCGHVFCSKVAQHHLYILFNAKKLCQGFPVPLRFLLKQQTQGKDRRLNLMCPHGIVIRHLFQGTMPVCLHLHPHAVQLADDLPVKKFHLIGGLVQTIQIDLRSFFHQVERLRLLPVADIPI